MSVLCSVRRARWGRLREAEFNQMCLHLHRQRHRQVKEWEHKYKVEFNKEYQERGANKNCDKF